MANNPLLSEDYRRKLQALPEPLRSQLFHNENPMNVTSEILIRIITMDGQPVAIIAGISIEQLEHNPELYSAVKDMIQKLIRDNGITDL